MKIGFVGLGRMGSAMAMRLVGHQDLTVMDTDAARTEAFARAGASVAQNAAGLVRCDLIISMLPSDESLLEAVSSPSGLAAHLPAGAVHMVCGTHGVRAMERALAAHAEHGQVLVSCTVLGRPERAAEGKLGLVPAGPPEVVRRFGPVFERLGDTVIEVGADPLSSVAVKIANNFVLGCAIEAIGEGMALARKYGADPKLFYRVMTEGLFDCIAYRAYADVIAHEDWGRIGATATIGLKDANLALEAAERAKLPLPSVNIWRDHLLSAIGRGEAALDWAVMAREQYRRSGLE